MDPIFSAQHHVPGDYKNTMKNEDFPTEDEAREAVERSGCGHIVKFAVYNNLPGCLPLLRHSSIWMKSYQDGKWKDHNIHT